MSGLRGNNVLINIMPALKPGMPQFALAIQHLPVLVAGLTGNIDRLLLNALE